MSKPTLKSIVIMPVNRGYEIVIDVGNEKQSSGNAVSVYKFNELDMLMKNIKYMLHAATEDRKLITDIQLRLQHEPETAQ